MRFFSPISASFARLISEFSFLVDIDVLWSFSICSPLVLDFMMASKWYTQQGHAEEGRKETPIYDYYGISERQK